MAEIDKLLELRAMLAEKIPIAAAFLDLAMTVGVTMTRVANLPPSKGYESYFIAAGGGTIGARGLAYVAVRHGKRVAREAKCYDEVANAIRFLAKARQRGAIERRARTLLKAWNETSVVETLFDAAGLNVFEFIRLLQELDDHGNTDYERLAHLAAQMVPHLSLSRGPKVAPPPRHMPSCSSITWRHRGGDPIPGKIGRPRTSID